jgi:hypothetical protein
VALLQNFTDGIDTYLHSFIVDLRSFILDKFPEHWKSKVRFISSKLVHVIHEINNVSYDLFLSLINDLFVRKGSCFGDRAFIVFHFEVAFKTLLSEVFQKLKEFVVMLCGWDSLNLCEEQINELGINERYKFLNGVINNSHHLFVFALLFPYKVYCLWRKCTLFGQEL